MSYRNVKFNRDMRSLDELASTRDISKWPAVSDGGKAAAEMYAKVGAVEGRPRDAGEAERRARLREAERKLADAGMAYLVPTLRLIVKNKDNREESMAMVPRRTYFLHRKLLCSFFGCTQVH